MNTNTLSGLINPPTMLFSGLTPETILPVPSPSPAYPEGSACIIGLESSAQDGKPYKLRLHGHYSLSGGPQTLAVRFYVVPPNVSPTQAANPANLVPLFSGPVINQSFPTSAGGNFSLSSKLLWDSTTQKLGGQASGFVDTGSTVVLVSPTTSNILNVESLANLLFAVSFETGAGSRQSEWLSESTCPETGQNATLPVTLASQKDGRHSEIKELGGQNATIGNFCC